MQELFLIAAIRSAGDYLKMIGYQRAIDGQIRLLSARAVKIAALALSLDHFAQSIATTEINSAESHVRMRWPFVVIRLLLPVTLFLKRIPYADALKSISVGRCCSMTEGSARAFLADGSGTSESEIA